MEISRSPVVIEGDPTNPTGDDPAGRHALVIGEILYDSPTTGDDFPTGKEYHEGEYIMLINKSGKALYLGDYQLRVGEDSLALTDTLPAGERVIVGFGDNAGAFGRLVALPAGFDDAVVMQNTLVLPDRSGIVRVTHTSGTEIDGLAYGDFYGLNAENLYLADSLIDSLSRRSSLKSVQRDAYGGPIGISGSAAEGSVGNSDPGVDPEPTEKAVVSSAYTHRGRKVYELKNHLGNVLAVVSDVKIGLSTSSQVEYYVADVVEMTDYEPFGMPLAMRHFVSGDGYRFGFQGQEGDDEWSGEGSMLAFKYRVHDVRLGRFLSVDPLSDSYPWNSTYAFSENRVLDAVELEGLESININSATYANKFRSIFAIKSTTAEEVIQKKNQLYQLFSKMDADERKSGANLYSIDYGYTKGVKLGTYSETIFNSERVYAPKEKSWDEQFEDPSVGIPFMIGVMAIVASGGTLLEAAPPVIAGAATFSEYAFFVVDVWGMASSVNGLAADADGNTPGSNLIEGIGASPEASRNIVTIADFCLNLGGATGDFMTVVTKPEAIGEFSGVLSQISGATDSPNGLVKLVSGVSAGLGSVSMGLDAKNIYDNSGGTSNDRKNDK